MMAKVKLGEICDFLNGFAFKSEHYVSNGIRIIRIANVQKGFIEDSAPVFYPLNDENAIKYALNNGDLLMSLTGNVGRVAILSKEFLPAALNQRVACIRMKVDGQVKKSYIFHLLNSDHFEQKCIQSSQGVAQKNMSTEWLKNYEIPLPRLEIQQYIINVLDKAISLISLRKQQLSKLDELVKSRFIEMFGDPVTNPTDWKAPKISEVVARDKNALKAGPFGSALKKECYSQVGYKVYGQEQVISGDVNLGDYYIPEEKYKELESCAVHENDILISLVGTYGKTLVIPHDYQKGIINPRLIKITFNFSEVNVVYFQYFFASDSLKQFLDESTHGCTMGVLNLGIIKNIRIPLPPLSLQNEFAAFVEQVDKSKFEIQKSLEKLETLKKALMQKYF